MKTHNIILKTILSFFIIMTSFNFEFISVLAESSGYSLTIDMQGRGETLICDVLEGQTIGEIIDSELEKGTIPTSVNGYGLDYFSFSSEESDYYTALESVCSTVIDHDYLVYAHWKTEVEKVEITVQSPKIGSFSGYDEENDLEINTPKATIDGESNCLIGNPAWIANAVIDNITIREPYREISIDDENYPQDFSGVFAENEEYVVEIPVMTEEGYIITENTVFLINGEETKHINNLGFNRGDTGRLYYLSNLYNSDWVCAFAKMYAVEGDGSEDDHEHTYSVTINWAEDYSSVKASGICTICGNEIEETAYVFNIVEQEGDCETETIILHYADFSNPVFGHQEKIVSSGGDGQHQWNEGYIITEPTFATNGIKRYTCSICNHTKEEIIPAGTDISLLVGGDVSTTLELSFNDTLTLTSTDPTVASAAVSGTGISVSGSGTVYTRKIQFYGEKPGVATITVMASSGLVLGYYNVTVNAIDVNYKGCTENLEPLQYVLITLNQDTYYSGDSRVQLAPKYKTVTSTITVGNTSYTTVHYETTLDISFVGEVKDVVYIYGSSSGVVIRINAEVSQPDYSDISYEWSADYSTVTATAVCSRCGNVISETTNSRYEVIQEASCDEEGLVRYTAVFGNSLFETQVKEVSVPGTNHEYVFDHFDWYDQYAAKAVFICQKDPTHVVSYEALVQGGVVTEPTCTESGVAFYSATYEEYWDQIEILLPPLGHDYIVNWEWMTDSGPVTAHFICTHDAAHSIDIDAYMEEPVETEPGCDYEGTVTYTAVVELDGMVYSDSRTEYVPPYGHTYAVVNTEWNDDYTMASVDCICTNDETHGAHFVTTNIVSTIVKNPTCEEDGLKTYTAYFEEEWLVYEATADEIIPAISHNYTFTEFEWIDYLSAKAVYVCTHDKSHVIKYDATVTSVIAKEPALGSPGKKVYTASYDDHSETKEEELNFITGSCKEGADYRLDVITGEMVITGKGVLSEIPYKDFVTSVTVGEGITAIAEDTFKDCLKLESVVLPDTLTTIGSGAFENCPVLEEIIIPESVTSIADDAVDNWEIITTGIKSVTGKAKKVKVIWKKVPKAIGYLVYRATSINGKYSKIATIKKATTLSYTDKKAKAGVTYYYKVKPVYSVTKKWKKITSTGAYSKPAYFFVFKAKPKISSTKNGVITWKKVSKATGYEVYRSLDKKTYELLGTTTTVKFTDTDIVPGVTYYYKVRALRDTDDKIIYSGYSAVKSYKKALATPTIKSAVYNKETKQIDIVVNEAKEAALGFEVGYDIQVSTSKKKGFKSVVITDNIGVKAITKKGTYYIKVRTYIVYNGKKYYSSYSKLKTLKVTSI